MVHKREGTLPSLGNCHAQNDYSIFLDKSSTNIAVITARIDDILTTGSNCEESGMSRAI